MEETQSLEKSKKPGRFTAVEKTSGKFYSSDIKSAQSNLSIDSPSTSGGIGVYHSDNLLPSTSTKKLFDDKKSEDTGDFVRFVTEDNIFPSEETDDEYESQKSSYQDKRSSKDSPEDTN
ncbi:hypothetical protein CDAR_227811 [Caerostris darwini]|uniref:Uncharacterized protein n=1 Tax=Caerostris darwini TaxID=1538125 RepID=A0AAV4WN61_9ARAC|nr:hypothetical protein CDAR_227811 [Caerostris darwini]